MLQGHVETGIFRAGIKHNSRCLNDPPNLATVSLSSNIQAVSRYSIIIKAVSNIHVPTHVNEPMYIYPGFNSVAFRIPDVLQVDQTRISRRKRSPMRK